MIQLKKVIKRLFGDARLYYEFQEHLEENERGIEDKGTTKTVGVDYLNDIFGFDLRDTEEEKMILNTIIKDRIPLFEDEVYDYDSLNITYNKIEEKEIKEYLTQHGYNNLIDKYLSSHQNSIVSFLKEGNEEVYREMLENKKGTDLDIESSLLNDISSDYGDFLNDSLVRVIENVIKNRKLNDYSGFKVDENGNTLIEVNEKEVNEKLVDYISNSKKGKQRLNYLKNERRGKFRDFNEYLDNKLDIILENTNSR